MSEFNTELTSVQFNVSIPVYSVRIFSFGNDSYLIIYFNFIYFNS